MSIPEKILAVFKSPRFLLFYGRMVWFASRSLLDTLFTRWQFWLWGVKVGRGFKAMGIPDLMLYPHSQIVLAENVTFCSDTSRYNLAQYGAIKLRCFSPTAQIFVGTSVWLNGTILACRSTSITIGAKTIFAGNVVVMDSDFHSLWAPEGRLNFETTAYDAPVVIGENCWLGLNVTILKGTILGDNVVVGAGSLVSGEFPPNCVIAGNPARVIKKLDG